MKNNQLYSYIETYINDYLHGFTKEQLTTGIKKEQLKLENLNLRPDNINEKLDQLNKPFWLKAGLITKLDIGCSSNNFKGEKPIDVVIEGFEIILTPSYKWIIKNIDSFIIENKMQMKGIYDPIENNSKDIFTKKINIFDNSIFKNEYIEEIFKDKTKISIIINKIFKYCYKFYYTKNFSINLTIRNLHIRFEDDQLINYNCDIALGCKIDLLELILNSEGTMKKDSSKINKLNIYWENPAKILIPNDLLNTSIKDGKLDETYYINLKKKFQPFKYTPNTKFIIENFSLMIKFGIKMANQEKKDQIKKSNNNYKSYFQLVSNELNLDFFPDLMIIKENFNKFVNEFIILEQVQDFKPTKKPYNIKSKNFIEFWEVINKNKKQNNINSFIKKKKMLVRDWLFYFYWCQKCKSSIISKKINPLRMEFSRFYSLCFNKGDEFQHNFNILEKKIIKKDENDENKVEIDDYNPDKINISYIGDISIKGLNINLHSSIKNKNLDFISIKMNKIEIKISLLKTQLDFDITCKSIIFGPNKLIEGEKVIINNNSIKKKGQQMNNLQSNFNRNEFYENSFSRILDNIEENTGLSGLVQKYNPNYKLKVKVIDEALEKIGNDSKLKKNINNINFNESEISMIKDNKNNEIFSQINEIVNNVTYLNDSKYESDINYLIPASHKGKGNKGKKF